LLLSLLCLLSCFGAMDRMLLLFLYVQSAFLFIISCRTAGFPTVGQGEAKYRGCALSPRFCSCSHCATVADRWRDEGRRVRALVPRLSSLLNNALCFSSVRFSPFLLLLYCDLRAGSLVREAEAKSSEDRTQSAGQAHDNYDCVQPFCFLR
jgi:hypothetical protein